MKKKLIIGSIAAAGAALIAAGAVAAEGKGPGQGNGRGWERMDANGDGKITADEVPEQHARFIELADANGDGAVTREEMKSFREGRRAEMREEYNPDKNGDGVVDRTEFVLAAQDRFDRLDKNGDGVLGEDEMDRGHGRRSGRSGKQD